ncbi:sec23/Sec24 protein transport family protein [Artemisia annua]|uniref:Multifunctional fusion protein n=1 Tax=Artemisia annua TaxID=35608 RepID=A0A2U1Q2N4_ARTAN|nr:sec23/Sec24 protein transport family protein [Artemisia annua]
MVATKYLHYVVITLLLIFYVLLFLWMLIVLQETVIGIYVTFVGKHSSKDVKDIARSLTKGPAVASTVIGPGNTTAWKLCGLDKDARRFSSISHQVKSQMHVNQQLYIQTVMSYQTIDGESKMRVTTIIGRWLESSAITEELVQGFDQETAGRSQVVGWPPVRNYRKNNIQAKKAECESRLYIQTVMSYQTIDGESKMRVTTIIGRWLESSAITEELVQGFDQETAGRSQVVGWPPVRNYRKNNIQAKKAECESRGASTYLSCKPRSRHGNSCTCFAETANNSGSMCYIDKAAEDWYVGMLPEVHCSVSGHALNKCRRQASGQNLQMTSELTVVFILQT